MASVDIEAIWAALAERLEDTAAETFGKNISRRRRIPNASEVPCLQVLDDDGTETLVSDEDDPAPIWRLTGSLFIWANAETPDSTDPSSKTMNALIKATREALERTDDDLGTPHYSNLGNLVRVLWVSRVEKGTADDAGVLKVARLEVNMETIPA